ncbi:MAG: TIM barrel protein [Chloroflexi bacterium]|nr:TIM barrel protein [Chloroflexota bacterium]
MPIRIACEPITWNAWPGYPEEQKLAEIAAAGYAGWTLRFPEFDDRGEPVAPPQATLARLAAHGLAAAPGYLSGRLWEADQRAALVASARARARFSRALDVTELFVACHCLPELFAITAQATGRRAAGLDDAGFDIMAATLDAMGAATLAEGVAVCFHNHAGSYVETEAEYEALIERIDPARVWLGPDTGHHLIGGGEVVPFFERHADRVRSVHLKDIDPAVLARGRAERLGYHPMVNAGLFAELGEGCIDFPAVLAALRGAGFDGWLIAETDKTTKPTARESVTISRAYLRNLGL